MSDFDEEAERERLREQYEREQKKREATEHMSELLLQGATMTDAHCDECGDPIFRYDGQTFCPTCKREIDPDAAGSDADESESTAASTIEEASEEPADTASGTAEASERVDATDAGPAADSATVRGQEGNRADRSASDIDPSTAAERVEVPAIEPEGDHEPTAPGDTPTSTGGLADARDALQNTLITFSRQAAATDDPRRARDALETAREAADALAALDQVR